MCSTKLSTYLLLFLHLHLEVLLQLHHLFQDVPVHQMLNKKEKKLMKKFLNCGVIGSGTCLHYPGCQSSALSPRLFDLR